MAKSVVCGGEIYFSAIFRFLLQALDERFAGSFGAGGITLLGSVRQADIILLGEFAVHRKIDGAAVLIRKTDREFHPLRRAGNDSHIFLILTGGKRLADQVAELHFTPDTPGLHVGKDFLQITDAGGQGMHFPNPL